MASPTNPGTPPPPPSLPSGGEQFPRATPPGSLPPGPPLRYRHRSIFSGLLLIIAGVLLLAATLHPSFSVGYAIRHYWPVIFIIWGIAKLIDRYAQPGGAPRPLLTGGEFGLIILLVVLVCFVAFVGWVQNRRSGLGNSFGDFGMFSQHYTETKRIDVKQVGDPKPVFTISTANGSINVHAGNGNELLVVGSASAGGNTQQAARDRLRNFDLSFDGPAGNYQIHPVNANGGGVSVDLDVQVPKSAGVSARTQRGDVTVANVQGSSTTSTRNGDLQIHDVGGEVAAESVNGDANIRNVGGDVTFTGRGGGDVDITDVQGNATVGGNVFGDVDLRNVGKGVRYSSPRATVQVGSLAGELKIDHSNVALSRATGPIMITARNQDMRLDGVGGQLDLNETHGDIIVTFAKPPNAPVNINNDAGDVTLNLPPQSSFALFAQSRSGDVSNDFAPGAEQDGDHGPHTISITEGRGGPIIHITTKYGDIHIGKTQ